MKDVAILMLAITCVCFVVVGGKKYDELREANQVIKAYELMAEMTIKQTDQLKDIIKNHGIQIEWRDGEFVVIGEPTPLTPEEFEEFKRRLRERKN